MAYAIPFGLTGILWIAQNDIHNYFVGYQFSSADFAIYAYGCFEVPLIAMLSESVTSVLIPRMNALQLAGDRDEMIRLTARAMQKLAFFYFPIYVFLLITAKTFIITLFTHKYEASASIFVINLTLLPFSILITDPVVRSFKELGRLFLLTRMLVLTALVAVLYFGLGRFSMTGMITAAVSAIILEKLIAETMVIRKLGLGLQHVGLLGPVIKTSFASIAAGSVTYLVYLNMVDRLVYMGEHFVTDTLAVRQTGLLDFAGGALVLAISALVFLPIYLLVANLLGVIEDDEKGRLAQIIGRIIPMRRQDPIVETQS
jgi:O-antigen/teichoic acid export membrane protein